MYGLDESIVSEPSSADSFWDLASEGTRRHTVTTRTQSSPTSILPVGSEMEKSSETLKLSSISGSGLSTAPAASILHRLPFTITTKAFSSVPFSMPCATGFTCAPGPARSCAAAKAPTEVPPRSSRAPGPSACGGALVVFSHRRRARKAPFSLPMAPEAARSDSSAPGSALPKAASPADPVSALTSSPTHPHAPTKNGGKTSSSAA
mmetsp:Transcript_43655/g.115448  ORF Transcript_43655/g.115448 Transcript_43655/m.115448 type:complete len:206 (-) Transcript_43655:1032-1649(-)